MDYTDRSTLIKLARNLGEPWGDAIAALLESDEAEIAGDKALIASALRVADVWERSALRNMEAKDWQDIATAPAHDSAQRGTSALLYSAEFGIQRGEIGNWPDGPRGSVAGYHGCVVRDWHVTHWRALPAPPVTKAKL